MASQTIYWTDEKDGVVVGEGKYVGLLARWFNEAVHLFMPDNGWQQFVHVEGSPDEAKRRANELLNLVHSPRAIAQGND